MMRRRNVLSAAAAAFCWMTAVAVAADLPKDVRESSAAPQAQQLTTYVGDQVKRVAAAAADPAAAARARDELYRQVESNRTVNPSPTFRFAYVSALEAQITPLLKSPNVVDRLNAAIILARVAAATEATSLQDEIVTLMDDPSPAVALWGVKGARAILPKVFDSAMLVNNEKLTAGILNAVARNPGTGAVVQEAYAALDLSQINPPVKDAAIVRASEAMLALLEQRTIAYIKGVPAVPLADRDPLIYFGRGQVFGKLPANDKLRVVQAFVNLMSVAAERSASQGGDTRASLLDIVSNAAGALQVQLQQNKVVADNAVQALKRLGTVRNLLPSQITPLINDSVKLIRDVPQFAALKDPPATEKEPAATANGG